MLSSLDTPTPRQTVPSPKPKIGAHTREDTPAHFPPLSAPPPPEVPSFEWSLVDGSQCNGPDGPFGPKPQQSHAFVPYTYQIFAKIINSRRKLSFYGKKHTQKLICSCMPSAKMTSEKNCKGK